MNRIPGFSAEQALSETGRSYALRAARHATQLHLQPQATSLGTGLGLNEIDIEPEQCVLRCRWRCTRYGCYPTDCYIMCF
ncbi:MAG: hypothetical protein JNK87_01340 [Bryobacterales bacterium]|nr:hypothetical protein [Bryobacterales bacterium]